MNCKCGQAMVLAELYTSIYYRCMRCEPTSATVKPHDTDVYVDLCMIQWSTADLRAWLVSNTSATLYSATAFAQASAITPSAVIRVRTRDATPDKLPGYWRITKDTPFEVIREG